MLALALTLALGPLVHPGPEGMITDGPVIPAQVDAVDRWLRSAVELEVRPDTRWTGRRTELAHGGVLWLLRETYQGHPVAGATLALRVGPDGRLGQLIGSSLSAELELGFDASVPWSERAQLWWPSEAGLVPVRVEDTPITIVDGVPTQLRHYVDAHTGEHLASISMIEEVNAPIRTWLENPLTTPTPVTYDVPLADLDPIVLQDDVFRVLDCNYSEVKSGCDAIFSPTADDPNGFPSMPPSLDDADAHRAIDDPYAALHFMHYAARAQGSLDEWGWDPFAWDVLNCAWQQTEDPHDCRVWVRTNMLTEDEDGVIPYASAYYTPTGVIGLGQGVNADLGYDGDIIGHEIGHHVVWSFGTPEMTAPTIEPSRLVTDIRAINEGSADLFAWMFGQNDVLFDYFSAIEPGPYRGPRTRDVSLAFRCPENVVGEHHMDGRIWVAALVEGLEALASAGLADPDAYVSTYLGALAAIRHIPSEQKVQLPTARAIVLDEIALSFGSEARDIVRDIFDARGVGRCDYVIDLREEPSISGEGGDAVLDARFLKLDSHLPSTAADRVAAHPFAPPVQHRITIAEGEHGVALSYRPGLWRDSPSTPSPELTAAALVKRGDEPVVFAFDESWVVHDAELRFNSAPDGERERIVIDLLEPGQTYAIALVSMSVVGTNNDLVMEEMSWELLEEDDGGSESETGDDGETGGPDTGGEPPVASDEPGCSCTSSDEHPRPGRLVLLLLGLGLVASRKPTSKTAC